MARPQSIRNCDQCGDDYQYRPNVFAKGMGRFCSKACSNSARPQPTELERWETYAHGVGVEPAHVPGIGPCTLWTGTIGKDGYGVFGLSVERQQVQAHIYAWELEHGLIRDGRCVCHRCDTRACIRLDHLFLDTRGGNVEDMMNKDRQAKGERMALAVLTGDRVRQIRLDYATGEYSQQELADREGVSQNTISKVTRGDAWVHVT